MISSESRPAMMKTTPGPALPDSKNSSAAGKSKHWVVTIWCLGPSSINYSNLQRKYAVKIHNFTILQFFPKGPLRGNEGLMRNDKNKIFDLEERTALFGENIIKTCKVIKLTTITEPIIKQLIRSSTSIGANYMEANGASSRKDFKNKIFICKKEAQESKHWLRMLSAAVPEKIEELRKHWQEAQELTLIFHKIAKTTKQLEN